MKRDNERKHREIMDITKDMEKYKKRREERISEEICKTNHN